MLEVALTGTGSALALALLHGGGWAIPGAALGLFCAFAIEWGLGVGERLRRLDATEAELARQRQQTAAIEAHANRKIELAQRETAVCEAWMEVFGGALSEAMKTGRVLPLDAIMARAEVTMKARGLDAPIGPPRTNPPLPET